VGRGSFNDAQSSSFQGSTFNLSKRGGAKFGGHVWTKNGQGSSGVAVVEGVRYGYGANLSVNGTLVAKSHVRGRAGIYHAAETNSTSTGASIDAYQAGKVAHFARTWVQGQNKTQKKTQKRSKPTRYVEMADDSDSFGTEESSLEFYNDEESGEFIAIGQSKNRSRQGGCKHHRCHHRNHSGIVSFLGAGWKSGTHTTVTLTSNTSNVVNSTNAAVYGATGWDSKTKKPWKFHGNRTVVASWKNQVSNQLDDIVVQLSDDQALVNKLAKLPDPKLPEEKEIPKKTGKETPKKTGKETPKKETPKKTGKEIPKKIGKEIPKKNGNK